MTVSNTTQPAPSGAIQFDITALNELVGDGRIFSTKFFKKNGELRHIVCRTGVHKGTNGTGLTYNPADKGLLSVWDVQNLGHRFITVKSIVEVKAHGQVFGGAL